MNDTDNSERIEVARYQREIVEDLQHKSFTNSSLN